jgi:hypothetical protein
MTTASASISARPGSCAGRAKSAAPRNSGDAAAEAGGGQDDEAAPAGGGINGGECDLAEPFAGRPGRAGHRERERVGGRKRPMREHPPPGGDVHISVGIVEQRQRRGQRAQHYEDADKPRPGRQPPAPCHRPGRGERMLVGVFAHPPSIARLG